jgi:hypothetical protein
MKIMSFYFGDQNTKYKFPSNLDPTLIDKTLREYFNISNDTEYHLFDMEDSSLINISTIHYLSNDSKILIKKKIIENSLISTCSNASWVYSFFLYGLI